MNSQKIKIFKQYDQLYSKVLVMFFVVIVASIGTHYLISTKAASQVSPAGTYTHIFMPTGNLTSISHDLTINDISGYPGSFPYFWTGQFGFQSSASGGAYLGLQGLNRVVFSVFGFAAVEKSPYCSSENSYFDGGNVNSAGTSCIVNYDLTQGHTYRLSVKEIGQDSLGIIWEASVEDLSSGYVFDIASVTLPLSWGLIGNFQSAWTEYFGPALSSCYELPKSDTTLSNFTAVNSSGSTLSPSSFSLYVGQNSCTAFSQDQYLQNYTFAEIMGVGYPVNNSTVTYPSAPSNLVAVPISSNMVALKWSAGKDDGGPGIAGYRVYRGPGIDLPQQINSTPINNNLYFDLINSPTNSIYNYRVSTVDNSDLESQGIASTTVALTNQNISNFISNETTKPTKPTDLKATAISPTQIDLKWSPSSDKLGIAAYALYRNNKPIQTITNVFQLSNPSFVDTGLSPNTTYTYSVQAVDSSANVSNVSGSATAVTQTPVIYILGIVTNAKTKLAIANVHVYTGDGKFFTYTNSQGVYVLYGMKPGKTYTYHFAAPGYTSYTVKENINYPPIVHNLYVSLSP